jgi:lysophospholipase L1-like esterase
MPEDAPMLANATVRMIVRPSIDGTALRIRLENTVATAQVSFSAAFIGVLDHDAAVVPGTNRALTFNGRPDLTLAAGAGAYGDPIPFPVKAFERLALSLDVTAAGDISTHSLGLTTNYTMPGLHADNLSGRGFVAVPPTTFDGLKSFPFYWISAVDVASTTTAGTVVAFGDSITDGRCSTTTASGHGQVILDLYERWTDVLAQRLAALPANYSKAIANEGIAGNRILQAGVGPAAIDRLDRDVLDRAGVTHVIFFEGTNDIIQGATAAEVIAGTRQIIDRVHAKGVKVIGVTMIPRGSPPGASRNGFTAAQERDRLEINEWIRHQAKFDGVIDFDAVMSGGGKSPTGAQMTRPEYTCDHIHPNSQGYLALGKSIDLQLFK